MDEGDTYRRSEEEEVMQNNFEASLKLVLLSEGGNDDDPSDHGGRTSRGITQREYTAWLHENHRLNADVWKASDDDVAIIYREEYWKPYCDLWPKGIDYLSFDMNVNAGPYRSASLMQRALGVREDGRVGPVTRGAIIATNPNILIHKFTEVKKIWYRGLNQPKYTKGWLNRADEVQAHALEMLKGK